MHFLEKKQLVITTLKNIKLFDFHVFALMGDGCFQEGVAREAISFAGHNKLDNLILIYDYNEVTLDAMAEKTQSEDTSAFFKAQGWEVFEIDGHSIQAIDDAIAQAKANDNGKPKIILARTISQKEFLKLKELLEAMAKVALNLLKPKKGSRVS